MTVPIIAALLATAGAFALGHIWGLRRVRSVAARTQDAWLRVSPDALLLLDDRERLLDANEAAQLLLGDAGLRTGAALAELDPKWSRLARWDGASGGALRVDGRSFEICCGEVPDAQGRRAGRWLRLRDVTEIVEADALVRAMVVTDELTGVANRRHFFDRAERELDHAYRYGRPLSLVTLGVGRLAEVNARFGYATGDALLRAVAASVVADVRSCDVVGRIEGDRFGLLLPETGRTQAEIVAARLHARAAEIEVPSVGGAARASPRVGLAAIDADDIGVDVPHDLAWLLGAARAGEVDSTVAPTADAGGRATVTESS